MGQEYVQTEVFGLGETIRVDNVEQGCSEITLKT